MGAAACRRALLGAAGEGAVGNDGDGGSGVGKVVGGAVGDVVGVKSAAGHCWALRCCWLRCPFVGDFVRGGVGTGPKGFFF